MSLTPEILPLAILEEPHPFVQPRHLPRLASQDGPLPRHQRHILQPLNLRHRILDPRPDPLDQICVVPDDPAAIARVCHEYLLAVTDVDHGWFPGAIALGFGGPDEGIAFVFCEDVV